MGLLLLVLSGIADIACANPDPVVEVDADGRVSFRGSTPSLVGLLDEVCWRAGVDLLFFDAPDRPYRGNLERLPFEVFLRRVLSEESYVWTARRATGSAAFQSASLQVLGPADAGVARRSRGGSDPRVRRRGLDVPPEVLTEAFAAPTGDAASPTAALEELAARISSSPGQRAQFLATDPAMIALPLARYPNAASMLGALVARYPDPAVQEHIRAIVRALERPAAATEEPR